MRPKRTVRRESEVTVRNGGRSRSLILIVPPTCDVLMIREKGRRSALEIDILTLWSVANKIAARKRIEERKTKRGLRI